jgi:dihydroorotate dehydrogenase electron transfer subunit
VRLLIGTDSEYAAIIRIANEMQQADERSPLLVLLGGADSFSFRPRPSTILVPAMPAGVIAAVPALEEFGIASRLASTAGLPGCYDGSVAELAEAWLSLLTEQLRTQTRIVVSGLASEIAAAEQLGRRFGIPVSSIPVLS